MRTSWKSLSGALVTDLPRTVRDLVGAEEVAVHVGTDSKNRGGSTHFVTVVAIPRPLGGGRVLYRAERHPRMHSLAQRLIHEAALSVEVASFLDGSIDQDVIVHLDVNQDEKHRSAQYARSLAGMGLGNGFQVRLKPEAWCASHVADHVVKEKHLRVA